MAEENTKVSFEKLYSQSLSKETARSMRNNLVKFFDLLIKVDQRMKKGVQQNGNP